MSSLPRNHVLHPSRSEEVISVAFSRVAPAGTEPAGCTRVQVAGDELRAHNLQGSKP